MPPSPLRLQQGQKESLKFAQARLLTEQGRGKLLDARILPTFAMIWALFTGAIYVLYSNRDFIFTTSSPEIFVGITVGILFFFVFPLLCLKEAANIITEDPDTSPQSNSEEVEDYMTWIEKSLIQEKKSNAIRSACLKGVMDIIIVFIYLFAFLGLLYMLWPNARTDTLSRIDILSCSDILSWQAGKYGAAFSFSFVVMFISAIKLKFSWWGNQTRIAFFIVGLFIFIGFYCLGLRADVVLTIAGIFWSIIFNMTVLMSRYIYVLVRMCIEINRAKTK